MKIKLFVTTLLLGAICGYAQSPNQDSNTLLSKMKSKQFDITQANKAPVFSNLFTGAELFDQNTAHTNTSQALNEVDLEPIAGIESEVWGALNNVETGNLVYFSASQEGNSYQIKTYDNDLQLEEDFSIELPASANYVQLVNHYSEHFFTDDNTKEFMIYVHYFDEDIMGPEGQIFEIWIVNSEGAIISKVEGNAAWAKYDDQGNKRLYTTYLDLDYNAHINAYSLADFSLLNSYIIGEDLLNFYMGNPIDFMTIDGQEYLVVSHYEKLFMDNMTMEIFPDNHLIIKLLDYDFNEVKTMKLNIDTHFPDAGQYVAPMAEFGTIYHDNTYNISKHIFNDDDGLEVLYGVYYYDMIMDSEWSTLRVGNEDGEVIQQLDEYIYGINSDMMSIENQDNQLGFLMGDQGGEPSIIGFFNIENWEMVATFDANQTEDRLSDRFNRIPFEDTYHYLIGIGEPDYEGDEMFGVINEYTVEGELYKRHQLSIPNSTVLFQPILTSDILTPNIFTTETDDLFFTYVYLDKNDTGENVYSLNVASDAENILAHFSGHGEKGGLKGAGLTMKTDKTAYDKFMLQYATASDKYLTDFYELPFVGDLGVDDIAQDTFRFYPNPTQDFLYLQSAQNFNHISVFDITGKMVLQKRLDGNQTSVDLSDLKSGIYLAQVRQENGEVKQIKVIKK